MIQHQEKDKVHKSMEKEQRAMTSTPTSRDFLLVQSVLFLRHFLQSSVPQKLGVASKVTTLKIYSIIFFAFFFTPSKSGIYSLREMPLWM